MMQRNAPNYLKSKDKIIHNVMGCIDNRFLLLSVLWDCRAIANVTNRIIDITRVRVHQEQGGQTVDTTQ